eukprot:superscaffoldBa00012199_g25562
MVTPVTSWHRHTCTSSFSYFSYYYCKDRANTAALSGAIRHAPSFCSLSSFPPPYPNPYPFPLQSLHVTALFIILCLHLFFLQRHPQQLHPGHRFTSGAPSCIPPTLPCANHT